MVVTIQYLRGLAALLVVYTHLSTQLSRFPGRAGLPSVEVGYWGVDIFFVISGFIMYITAIHIDESPKRFLLKRAVRIIPLYWAVTLFLIVCAFLVPNALSTVKLDLKHVIASFLFIPWPNPGYAGYWPVLIPGWTLNYEMFFYLIVAVSLLLVKDLRVLFVLISISAIVCAGMIVNEGGIFSFYAHNIILEFALGVVVGYVFKRQWRLGLLAGALCVAASFMMVFHLADSKEIPRIISYGLPAVLLVIGFLEFETLAKAHIVRPAVYLGDISYSLYLTHVIALPVLTAVFLQVLNRFHYDLSAIYLPVAVLVAVMAGGLTYALVEMPLTRLLQARLRTRSVRQEV
ncbi:acyltransferase family protein [Bosea sp. PAMC 26642]|uniref:acyltransferase family protein n=1 Tax=Bosea sp. (strain PAMC 26642) TaxID=1792307 RepID=UPI000770401B|nr:acyltransferase [Bosea sp. PAMC 26642]AMJ61042.1 hypothetical protein AXW83_12730 [Bosea sp. PAMC 26642]